MKLFSKTLLMILALFAVVAVITSVLSLNALSSSLTNEYRSKGVAITQAVVDSGTELLMTRDLATVQATLDQFSEIDGVAYVFVTDADNEVVSHTFVPGLPPEVPALIQAAVAHGVLDTPVASNVHVSGIGEVLHVHGSILAGVAGYAHVGMDLGFIRAQIRSVVWRQQLLILATFLGVALLAWFAVRRVSGPLQRLAGYTRSMAARDFGAAQAEPPPDIVALRQGSKDEIGQLAGAFLDMESELQRHIEDLRIATAAKQRIESELAIARDIQRSLVPSTFPPFPDRPELNLHAELISAREVSGDFYDFFLVDERHLCFVIGDVSDKGVPASLFMALTRTLLRALARLPGASAQSIVTRLNEEISRDNESCMFVTLFCGVLDTQTGEVSYCNAGHNPPWLLGRTGPQVLDPQRSPALGMSPSAKYAAERLQLEPGDLLFLYTDGVTEAQDANRQLFGDQRLQDALNEHRNAGCQALIRGVLAAVRAFVGDTPASDDLTLLALRYRGPELHTGGRRDFHTAGDPDSLATLTEAWQQVAGEAGLSADAAFRGRTVLEEVVTNAYQHGGSGRNEDIRVRFQPAEHDCRIEIRYPGAEFDLTAAEAPQIDLSVDERPIGGLGIHLVRNLADDLRYRHESGTNTVVAIIRERET